jgi:WD40 repeat protein
MNNSFAKLTTIPFPNPIEGLLLRSKFDLFVAVNPSEVKHFDLKNKRLMKNSVLNLNEDEIITGIHHSCVMKNLLSEEKSCLMSTHTGTIYEVMFPDESDTPKLNISRQYVGSLDEILCAVFWVEGTIAVANNTNVIKVYTLETGSCSFLRGHKDIVLSLSTHKSWLVSCGKVCNFNLSFIPSLHYCESDFK